MKKVKIIEKLDNFYIRTVRFSRATALMMGGLTALHQQLDFAIYSLVVYLVLTNILRENKELKKLNK